MSKTKKSLLKSTVVLSTMIMTTTAIGGPSLTAFAASTEKTPVAAKQAAKQKTKKTPVTTKQKGVELIARSNKQAEQSTIYIGFNNPDRQQVHSISLTADIGTKLSDVFNLDEVLASDALKGWKVKDTDLPEDGESPFKTSADIKFYVVNLEPADETEGEDNETEGEGNETEGEGNETEGEGNETEGEGNETEGEGNETEGEDNETEGEDNETEGEDNETEGEGNEAEGGNNEIEGGSNEIEGEDNETESEGNEIESEEVSVNVTRTIEIVDEDGNKISDDIVQSHTFTKENNEAEWTDSDKFEFKAVEAPTVKGYEFVFGEANSIEVTPETKSMIIHLVYRASDEKPEEVKPEEVKAGEVKVEYIDSVTNKVIDSGTYEGKVGELVKFDNSVLEGLIEKGYVVAENPTANPVEFTEDSQTLKVVLNHGLEDKVETKTIKRIFNFVVKAEANKNIGSIVQEVIFTRTITTDLVTKEQTISEWASENDEFPEVTFTEQNGYKPEVTHYNGEKVTPDSKDSVYNVYYTKADEDKIGVNDNKTPNSANTDINKAPTSANTDINKTGAGTSRSSDPQTGIESSAVTYGILGAMLAGIAGFFGINAFKKKENE